MIVFKRGCIVVLVVFQLIFLDRTCHSQFHWGKNYEMEADNLRALLQRYASNQVPKTMENVPKQDTTMDSNHGKSGAVLDPIRNFLLVSKKYWVDKKSPSNAERNYVQSNAAKEYMEYRKLKRQIEIRRPRLF